MLLPLLGGAPTSPVEATSCLAIDRQAASAGGKEDGVSRESGRLKIVEALGFVQIVVPPQITTICEVEFADESDAGHVQVGTVLQRVTEVETGDLRDPLDAQTRAVESGHTTRADLIVSDLIEEHGIALKPGESQPLEVEARVHREGERHGVRSDNASTLSIRL